jgi:two-component system cell cycle sensor histidine kinase/response regulator CckA
VSDAELAALRAEVERLRVENEELRHDRLISLGLFEHAPVAIEVFDEQGYALWLNQAQVDFFGLPGPEVVVGTFNCLSDPQIEAQGFTPYFERAYAGEIVKLPELQIDLAAYQSRWQSTSRKPWFEGLLIPLEDADGRIVGVASFTREITKAKEIEAALLAAQRHESLGLLAGGLAHDFNNLLTAIMGNASVAQLHDLSRAEIDAHLEQIVKATEHASLLTRQLLAYAGKGRFRQTNIELGALVRDMTHILRVIVSNKISIRIDSEGEHWVSADEVQVQQVVMNLITNAAEAIGDDANGTIAIQLTRVEADHDYLERAFGADELEPGRYVCIEVSDSGCGMDETTRERLFDPFFTTMDRGHGLGMAAILGIVRGHHGAIRIYSVVGEGTTIKVLLPELPREQVHSRQEPVPQPGEAPDRLRILVADDESFIRLLAERVLEREGHEIVSVADGAAAVETFAKDPESYDLVLLDMSMPKLSGPEVFRELRRIDPKVRVLLTSGYNEQETVSRFAGKRIAGFLQKPYRAQDLRLAIERLVEGE